MNSRFKATEQTTNACRKGRNALFAINGILSNSTKPQETPKAVSLSSYILYNRI